MATPSFRDIVRAFHSLPLTEQDAFLRDVYTFSSDTKTLLVSKLIGSADFSGMITNMERETIGKVYRKGTPGMPRGSKVNEIIRTASAAEAPLATMLQLEQLAYRGFIEFLDEFGGGPENFDDMACRHLEAYLRLASEGVQDERERQGLYESVRCYLLGKNNMLTDCLDDVFEKITGWNIGRS